MNELDSRLKRLFTAAKPARRARVQAEAAAPFGFAMRVTSRRLIAAGPADAADGWATPARWGLGLACGVMLLSLAWNWRLLNPEWSPALTVAEHVTELVTLP